MSHFVVDTNVIMVADGQSPQASPACVECSINALEEVKTGKICLDEGMRILIEYMQNLGYAGRPGLGKAFAKWVWENQANPDVGEVVRIYPNNDREFEEFPDNHLLKGFDRNDRKFVAVALASPFKPEIMNAVDKHWWVYREQLKQHDVKIRFVYPAQFF